MVIWEKCTKCNTHIPFQHHRWLLQHPMISYLCDECKHKGDHQPIIASIGGLMFAAFMIVIALKVALNIIIP